MFRLWDDVGREAHLLCKGWQNLLQERLHQVHVVVSLYQLKWIYRRSYSVRPTLCHVKMAQQEMMVKCKHGSTTKYVLCNCVYHPSSDICTKI